MRIAGTAGILALLCILSPVGAEPPGNARSRHVVLLSIDGLAASYLNDPQAELPTIRKLMAEGASAEGMLTSFPSVTWPSHITLITGVEPGRHGVIGNGVWNRSLKRSLIYIGDPELTKEQSVRVPTVYDSAHAAGLKCGAIIWPCVNDAKTLRWAIPDSNKPELHARYTTPGFVSGLLKHGIDISKLGEWGWDKQKAAERDALYTRVAQHLLTHEGANLLLLHLITPDAVEHSYGPHTREAYAAVKQADEHVREIWETLQQPQFKGNSTLIVVSDHGFAPVSKVIRTNRLLRDLGLVEADEANKATSRKAWCVAQGGSSFLYWLDEKLSADEKSRVIRELSQTEGVAQILEPAEFQKLGLPAPDKNPEAPHLVLLTGPGYSFNDGLEAPVVGETTATYRGTHGHNPHPAYMHATFVAAGAGIRPGVRLKLARNLDVAPTIAALLGVPLKDVDGKPMEILTQPSPK